MTTTPTFDPAAFFAARTDRQLDFLRKIGPHLQVGEIRTEDVPAGHRVAAHRNFLATTNCGREVATTLVTKDPARVRCPGCAGWEYPATTA